MKMRKLGNVTAIMMF